MTKPYSEEILSQQLTSDRTWRLREISDLKTAAFRADANLQRVLLRALVTICYAHWEGYVRFAAQKYLEHVSMRKLRFGELDPQFLRNHFMPRLAALSRSKTSLAERCALIDEILGASTVRFSRANLDLVSTANLNYDVFCDICLVCGINPAKLEIDPDFVDVFLLKRRNSIAHGEDTLVGAHDLDELADKTMGIVRLFGNALENRALLGKYRAA
ncbi:MAE_28990/MAE_18760 family HEPN-like nuclease [Bordetella petrii]|uniref:MAE_28990/MAE_18760 family HEPN-like nuclease n=1 Tax=Bordetella petrii TaxID=94624 RepID=UPI00373339F3